MIKIARLGQLSLLSSLAFVVQSHASVLTNGSFENVSPQMVNNEICRTPSSPATAYSICSAAGWAGDYQIGKGATVGVFGISFGIPQPDPDGDNALILQSSFAESPNATQSILIANPGLYTLSFFAANRRAPAGNNGPQTVSVALDGSVLPNGVFQSVPVDWTAEALTFSLSAGNHLLTLQSPVASSDVSAFIDQVSLSPATTPEPSSCTLAMLALGLAATLLRRKLRRN